MTRKRKSKTSRRTVLGIGLAAGLLVVAALWLHSQNIAVLNPAGPIASQERHLMFEAALLGMLVIVPVFTLTIWIAVTYRASNPRTKKYTPTWDHSRWLESVWWAIPLTIIGVLSVITWRSSYALDPFKPLTSTTKPLTVQVVALDWKWLFIYPDQQVASVNQVALPIGRPVTFQITSDSVMNSFWIPQLSGQIYAMPGMSTELHVMADKAGDYKGSSANISGNGFAGMTFTAKAESEQEFTNWVSATRKASPTLSLAAYTHLANPSHNNTIAYYTAPSANLYQYVTMKYMLPGVVQ